MKKGEKMSEILKKKIGDANRDSNVWHTHPHPRGMLGKIAWNKGKPAPWAKNNPQSFKRGQMSGVNNTNWKGGITKLQEQIRKSFNYRQWRSDVFTRDIFTCQECGNNKSGNLEAHHIKSFSLILKENNIKTLEEALNCEELWNINNGRTLCKECHKKTDSYLVIVN